MGRVRSGSGTGIFSLTKWPVAHQQLRVETRHSETFIVASGKTDAPPLVLLHGTLANSTVWMADVSAWAADFRVYAVDVIGEPGLSAPVRLPLDSDAHALWLDDVFDALSISCASLVGVCRSEAGLPWTMQRGGPNV